LVVFVFSYLAFKSTRYGILIGFFGYLAFKSTRYGILIGFLNFRNGSRYEVVCSSIYLTRRHVQNTSNRVRVFASPRCCAAFVVCSIPSTGVHRRTGEQVFGTVRSCDPAPGEGESDFWEAPSATARLLRHGSSSVQVRSCGVSSSATPVPVPRSKDRLRPVCVVHHPGGSHSVRIS